MIADVKKSADQKMHKTIEALKADLGKVRTGRAHTGLLDHIQVDYYGSNVPISQVAREAIEDRLGLTGDGPRELPFASLGASGLPGIANSDEAYLSEHWPDAIDRDR